MEVKTILHPVTLISYLALVTARGGLLSIRDSDIIFKEAESLAQIPVTGQVRFSQIAHAHDLPCTEHEIQTEDGYWLKLYHVHGKMRNESVLLVHGFLDSSDSFILRGFWSLVTALARARGYDVWVANFRGNSYSRRHANLNPDLDEVYWDFSYEEFGRYDLPAIIDHILAYTHQTSLRAIAHSLGATSFFVMGSMRPEYNRKVELLIALAPVGASEDTDKYAAPSTLPIVRLALNSLQQNELFGSRTSLVMLFKAFCSIQTNYKLCSDLISVLSGGELLELNSDFLPVLVGHYPQSTSKKNALHYLQILETKRLARYDYGAEGNLVRYNDEVPPEYDLGLVTMPVALIFAKNDRVSTSAVAKVLKGRLPKVVDLNVLQNNNMQHMDFLWAKKDINIYLFRRIFDLLLNFTLH